MAQVRNEQLIARGRTAEACSARLRDEIADERDALLSFLTKGTVTRDDA